MTLEDYLTTHCDAEPAALRRLYRHTHLTRLYPRMCTDAYQGRLLVMLTRMINPRNVLELGTFSGYSALCFNEGMAGQGRVDTVEIDPEHRDDLLELFEGTGVHLHIGDAMELIPRLMEERDYDLVFIDANKRVYTDYYNAIIERVRPGAYILADNTLWDDKVLLDQPASDPQTAGIKAFNDLVAADSRVEKIILPVRDGLSVIRIR